MTGEEARGMGTAVEAVAPASAGTEEASERNAAPHW